MRSPAQRTKGGAAPRDGAATAGESNNGRVERQAMHKRGGRDLTDRLQSGSGRAAGRPGGPSGPGRVEGADNVWGETDGA